MLDPTIILYPNYIHQDFKDEFTNRLLESIGYISEFVEIEKPSSLNINWKICAAHYLAIKRAENQDLNSVREYISYIKSQSHNPTQQIKILPMVSHDSSFEKDMIFEILQDDPTVGIGFSNDAHVNNNEALKIEQALHFIKLNNMDFYNEIIKYIDTIYLTGSSDDGSRVMRSGTNFYMWGMMFLRVDSENSIPYYVEHIIHECAHTTLNLVNGYDELVTNLPSEGFSAPFRQDLRPMIGIFHAYFVLHRVCLFFKDSLNHSTDTRLLPELKQRFDDAKAKLIQTSTIIEQNAKLTSIGRQLHHGIRQAWSI